MATGRIGVTPTLRTRWSDQPTAGTTSLSGLDDNSVALVYDVGYEAVYRNGVLLSRGNDYTATNGTTVTLTEATIAGDIIEIFANQLVPLADAISKGQYTAKGALLSATAASTPGVLTVGTDGQVLTAASGQSTGLQWATPSGSLTLSQIATGTLSGTSVNLTGLSSYDTIVIAIVNGTWATANSDVRFRINGVSTGGLYYYMGGAGLATGTEQRVVSQGVDAFESNNNQTFNNATNARILTFENCKSAGFTTLQENASYQNTSTNQENMNIQGWFASAAAVSSIAITTTGGYSFNGGTYYVIAG